MATTVQTDTIMAEALSPAPSRPHNSFSRTIPLNSDNERPSSLTVSKPTPYTFDLGHLLVTDPNPLPPTTQLLPTTTTTTTPPTPTSSSRQPSTIDPNEILKSTARDGAQTLLNNLLTNRPITSSTDPATSGLSLSLPPAETHLPRWKALPKPKVPTKWEAFAKKKGIGRHASGSGAGKSGGGAQLEEKRKNLVFDEESGEWKRKWGYKGKNKDGEGTEWLVELDDKKKKGPKNGRKKGEEDGDGDGRNVRMEGKRERMEQMRRQLRKERSNAKRGGVAGGKKS